MTDVLKQSSVLKIQRAFEIRTELRDLLEELLSSPGAVSRRDNQRETSSPTVWVEWVLDSAPDYTRAAILLGDVIHNLRAALDHAVWAVTPQHAQANPTDVSFPLYTREDSYLSWARKRKDWYGPTVFEVLRGCQPFNAGETLLHPLHILQFLSNTDKHRVLNIVAHNQVNMGEVTVVPEPAGGVVSTVNDGVVGAGSVLARVEFARPMAAAAVDLKPVFAYEQVFRYVDQTGAERWLQVGDAMDRIWPEAVEAVGLMISAHERDVAADPG